MELPVKTGSLENGRLRIHDPAGSPFVSYVELARQREMERQRATEEARRADQERRRAEEERRRADDERQRADQLATKLRALGVDPEH